jgi:hypothetical protein
MKKTFLPILAMTLFLRSEKSLEGALVYVTSRTSLYYGDCYGNAFPVIEVPLYP